MGCFAALASAASAISWAIQSYGFRARKRLIEEHVFTTVLGCKLTFSRSEAGTTDGEEDEMQARSCLLLLI